jgi:hypothetical protein
VSKIRASRLSTHHIGVGLLVFACAVTAAMYPFIAESGSGPSSQPAAPWTTVVLCFGFVCAVVGVVLLIRRPK